MKVTGSGGSELPHGKNNQQGTILRSTSRILILVTLTLIVLTVVPLYYPLRRYSLSTHASSGDTTTSPVDHPQDEVTTNNGNHHKCDVFSGEWIPNPDAPYYDNMTCLAIQDHQNCQKYGRPDSDFMKWRWKPDGCDLPIFNPYQFLEIVRDKSLAFVGDSMGRNQMQSLICMLSRVEHPIDRSIKKDENFQNFKRWYYVSYNFTLAAFWSPFLVKSELVSTATHNGLFNLYLDEFDEKWTTQIDEFNYLIINTGHWFWGRAFYYTKRQIIGCTECQVENVTNYPMTFGYRRAIRTAFKAINNRGQFKGITILRTFSPAHFDGEWYNGGDCVRKMPFKSSEITLNAFNLELYMIQMEEFRQAEKRGKEKGLKYKLLDITQVMLLRPDGHPSKYGHWPNANVTLYNDCVHWCLPGPIDTWSDLLLHMLKMEVLRSPEENSHPRG